MLKSVLIAAVLLVSVTAADARAQRPDPSPFSHAPCSVLDGEPCTPSFCSVFSTQPCLPEIYYPSGQNLQLTVLTKVKDGDAPAAPTGDLNTLQDLFAALRACWQPPPIGEARADMQITVRISFKRSGALFAAPGVTFSTPGIPADVRELYRRAIADSLKACTPLHFTDALGGAVAGRPILVRYIDNRVTAKRAEGTSNRLIRS